MGLEIPENVKTLPKLINAETVLPIKKYEVTRKIMKWRMCSKIKKMPSESKSLTFK